MHLQTFSFQREHVQHAAVFAIMLTHN